MQSIKDPRTIIADLQSTPYMVTLGTFDEVYIQVSKSEDEITLWHNLGSSPPTKLRAIEIIATMEACGASLMASEEIRAFVGGRSLAYILHVASGHMDFMVARHLQGITQWDVELE